MHCPPKSKLIVALGGVLLAASASVTYAAGLGKLSINSSLGQPLSAEIELVSLLPGEFESITARVASPESYGDAKVDYSPLLRQVRFSTARRADGKPILRISSTVPINEPFLDVLVEVTWPAGRLQREYPILLDPPGFSEIRTAASIAPLPAPISRPAEPATAVPAVPTAPVAAAADAPTAPVAAAADAPMAPVAAAAGTPTAPVAPVAPAAPAATGLPSAKAESAAETYGPVQRGDTLNKIASESKPDTVSLEQMLVALYRENRTAFMNNNMNRLKTGQILRVPSAEEAGKISLGEARKEIKVQVSDWKAYREQVAGAVTASEGKAPTTTNAASGKIAVAQPDKPVPAAAPADQLKIAKMDSAMGKAGSAGAKGGTQDQLNALREEAIAKENQLKEANSRVTDLEKQIKDMRKLLELKGAAPVAPVVKAPEVKAPVAAMPQKAAEPEKSVPAPETKAATPPVAAKPGEPNKPDDAKSVDAKPAVAPKPAQAPPSKVPAKAVATPEPSLLDMLQDNAIVIGGVISLLGFGGLIAFMRRKKRSSGGNTSQLLNTSSIMPSDLKPNTATGNRAGGLVDTGNSSFLTDFDKTGPGAIDTDEVDPVAEAEVYIAYGRDAQAEEILKEAMTRDKGRHEIAMKLLEIYHARKSPQAFETVARELKTSVGADHPMWAKAAALGVSIDPGNSLYGGVGQAYAATGVYAAGGAAMMAAEAQPAAPPDLDFDLGFTDSAASPTAASRPIDITSANTDQPAASSMDFDLDLNASSSGVTAPAAPAAAGGGLDFDLAFGSSSTAPPPAAPAASSGFDFDLSALSLDEPAPAAAQRPAATPVASLSEFSLDLGAPADAAAGGASAVATKLELAKAYIEIGDSDGAKEILNEVAREGSAAQQDEAKMIMAGL